MAFRFRHFVVEDDRSTMPVGTDAMLLGSWTDPRNACRVLDLGTGCGVLALMVAQRSTGQVLAIDIDPDSAEQARLNFSRSPWNQRLSSQCVSASELAERQPGTFNLIISNPPYFSGSLRSPSHRKNLARHDTGMTREQMVMDVSRLLAPGGELAIVMPVEGFRSFSETAAGHELFPVRFLFVRSFAASDPIRVLALFSKCGAGVTEKQELIIFEAPGKFTGEYLELTSEFHYF